MISATKEPQLDELCFYESAEKLLRYGHYSAADEDRLLNSYLEPFPKSVPQHCGGQRLPDFDPRKEIAPNIRLCLRHGFYLRVIAVTEATLKELCACAGRRKNLRIKANDLRGSSPRKYRDYLEKRILIDFTAISAEWDNLETLFLIRHCWAHADGVIDNHQKEKIRLFATKTKLAELSGAEDTVTIKPELVGRASEHALKILSDIRDALIL